MIYLDQIEADMEAIAFLEGLAQHAAKRTPHVEVRWSNHENDGRTGSLWIDGKVCAMTVVLRDDLNRSVLTTHLETTCAV